jgi:hypothetical protein
MHVEDHRKRQGIHRPGPVERDESDVVADSENDSLSMIIQELGLAAVPDWLAFFERALDHSH